MVEGFRVGLRPERHGSRHFDPEAWQIAPRHRGSLGVILRILAVAAFSIVLSTPARSDTTPIESRAQIPSGSVARWGNYFGGPTQILRTPRAMTGLAHVVAIDASNSSNYALECAGGTGNCPSDGTVVAWGDGGHGQLGDGMTSNSQKTVRQVVFPLGVHIVSIGEARNEGFAIDATGQAWGWGNNGHGSLCLGNTAMQTSPVMIPDLTSVTAVQGGQDHVLWLTSGGKVMACGIGTSGQLGTGKTKSSTVPVTVVGLSNIVQITAGNTSSGAIDSLGRVYMWGFSRQGQTGVTSSKLVSSPTRVHLPLPAIALSAGGDIVGNGHTIAILSDHSVYAWGDDSNGQLGDGMRTNEFSPVPVDLPAGLVFTSAAAGGNSSLALDTNGDVYAWGGGSEGQLGAGNLSRSLIPLKIDSGVDMISATAYNSLDLHA